MYEQMQEVYKRLQARGLEILAFPCNQFGKQEPKTEAEIKEFVAKKGATFPLFGKIDVNGKNADPIFVFLKSKLTGVLGSSIKWNFTKFLCDRNGKPLKRYSPPAKPLDFEKEIVEVLESNA
jgi:glutathione peroxidase-family protein